LFRLGYFTINKYLNFAVFIKLLNYLFKFIKKWKLKKALMFIFYYTIKHKV